MDRMGSLLTNIATQQRVALINDDTETDPDKRRDRAEASPGCRLKFDDDCLINGSIVKYICPSNDPGWFYALGIDETIIAVGTYEAQYVTDRAPSDEEEEPLPIFLEPA